MPRKAPDPGFALDRQDRQILRIVQRTSKVPHRIIAEAINLSTAAVQRRVTAMEAAGVITKNVALVDPAAVSVTITAIVEVQLNDER
ncbi:MAG: winged helix-turn-helix transcriptional regulator, partial [Anaerolineae bacterium]|nr:winged helix-turn-helix transcriptional regulator [Anaerolineae bacterium]